MFNKEKKEDKLILKQIEKERIRYHKKMIEQEKINCQKDKIAPNGSFISLQHVNKIYDNHIQAVYDFNLEIKEKEFIVFVGPSGCGKSTTLRMIAGLEVITAGDLYINGIYSNAVPAKERNIAMVFQNYALYPHLTIYENMAFSLRVKHLPNDEIDRRIKNAADILQINEYLSRKPNALSGGQCQRVALGRAIVRDSKLFLMDEPLSNLDAKLRVAMRSEIIKLHNRLDATTIYVTHDQTEAMTMATRIVVMNKGYIQQIGTPQEIYNKPANTFVASFIGSPSMNLLDVKFDEKNIVFEKFKFKVNKAQKELIINFYQNGLSKAKADLQELEANSVEKNELIASLDELNKKQNLSAKEEKNINQEIERIANEINILNKANQKRKELINIIDEYQKFIDNKCADLIFGIRPDDIIESDQINEKINPSKAIKLTVNVAELLGNMYYLYCDFNGKEIIISTNAERLISANDKVDVVFNLNKVHLFDKVTQKLII